MLELRLPISDAAKRRARGIVIALAIELAILLALLTFGEVQRKLTEPGGALTTFNVQPDEKKAETTAAREQQQKRPVAPPPPPSLQAPPPPIRNPDALTAPPGLIVLSRDDYAASDIGKMPSKPAEAVASAGDDTPLASGKGPGGAPLYRAEWYREPTEAETIDIRRRGPGKALVACRTVERYHVEDCRSMGETPVGTGLGNALRRAAWQFLVRPPRRGGKPLIGEWVLIEFTIRDAKARNEDEPD